MTALQQIRDLRKWRQRRTFDTSISRVIDSLASTLEDSHRKGGAFVQAWEDHLPARLHAKTRVVSISRGIAHVAVEGSSVRYEVDRLLRSGLLPSLKSSFNGTLYKVKLTVTGWSDHSNR